MHDTAQGAEVMPLLAEAGVVGGNCTATGDCAAAHVEEQPSPAWSCAWDSAHVLCSQSLARVRRVVVCVSGERGRR
eukprot:CAMPEP_0179486508 /NCGR_PEP_ID=MMETSP0799-20121207/62783_1 /TAXON_ID=46947 /ORGANISM="Geminigera cryophila, Strain CCMP2564" /LENGTH=75 /DNA_ID=CAMNT_0021301279 /DNA_START=551 /DNA_END=776 /DNA_ORIENTATION=-